MRKLQLVLLAALLLLCTLLVTAQTANPSAIFTVIIVNEQKEPLEGAVVDVLKTADKKLIKSAVTNKNGVSVFYIGLSAEQQLSVTNMDYEAQRVLLSKTVLADKQLKIILRSNAKTLDNISVNSRKAFIQQAHGK